jgi:outer membrane protein TolC
MKQISFLLTLSIFILPLCAWAQSAPAAPVNQAVAEQAPSGPAAITLADALSRAKVLNPKLRAATTDAGISREDRVQARAALLPAASYAAGAIYSQPNQLGAIKFIAANGVREYISQGIAQESLSFASVSDYRRARAAEALSRTRAEIAARGLNAVVVQAYYAAIVAERKTSNAQQAADEAGHFLKISQQLEGGGEVAHSDAIKAHLQSNDRARDLAEAKLAEEKARLDLAVLITPDFTTGFTLVDDLRFSPALPEFTEVQSLAGKNNVELRAALQSLDVANKEVWVARGGHLPSVAVNYAYGFDAPQFATQTNGIRNVGYQVAATVNIPIWSWGSTQSKVKQAEFRRDLARVELSAAQRQAVANLKAAYDEAHLAHVQLDLLRNSAEMASEGLRLTNLRYQAGEATALEVVDAQNTLTLARNGYDDGEARYRLALASLQTVTGPF